MKKTLLRFVSMVMAVAMLVCSANLTVFAAGSSSEGVDVITTILESDTWKDELTYEEIDVLSVDAFTFDTNLDLKVPALNGGAATVEHDGGENYTVNTPQLATGLSSGAKWIAKSAVASGSSGDKDITLSGDATEFTYTGNLENVKVTYGLAFTDIDLNTVNTIVNLPNTLVGEVEEQTTIMETLLGNMDDIKLVQNTVVLTMLDVYFPTQAAQLKSECMVEVESNKYELVLLNYVKEYENEGLLYFYTGDNSDKIIAEIDKLSRIIETIAKDPEFDKLVADIEGTFGSSIADKMLDIKEMVPMLDGYRDRLQDANVNENIDRNSENLVDLLVAVELAAGYTNAYVVSDNKIEYTAYVQAPAPGKAYIAVTLKVEGQHAQTYSENYSLQAGDTIDAGHLDDLKAILEQLKGKITIDITNYDLSGSFPEIGADADAISEIIFTYKPRKYTVQVEGGVTSDKSFSADKAWSITLPRPDAGYKYTYNIAGDEFVVLPGHSGVYEFTDLSIFDGEYKLVITCTKEEYYAPVDTSDLLDLIADVNAAFAAGNLDAVVIPVEAADGEISLILRVSPKLTGIQLEAVGGKLIEVLMKKTDSVALGNSTLYDGQLYLQAIVDFMANSGFGFDAFCNVVGANGRVTNDAELSKLSPVGAAVAGGVGGKLIESTLVLNCGNASTEYPFYVTIQDGVATDTLAKTRELIAELKGYINIDCSGDSFNVTLNSPDSVYPYYLMAMLVLDKAELADPQDMDLKECVEYEFSLVKPLILDDNFTIETLENTLAKAGQNYDLSQYATEFDYVRKLLEKIIETTTVETSSSDNVYSVSAKTESAALINSLLSKFGMEMVKDMFAEAADGSTVNFNFTVTLADMNNEYDALVFDYSKSGLKKFTGTYDLAATLNSVGENAVIVLMNDVTLSGPVNIKNRTFINLNGYTITGDMNASAAVRITDATLEADKGGVNGKLTGAFTLTGGKYTADVDALLASGYSVDGDGYVVNNVYTVTKTGNDVEIALNADFLYDYSSVSSSKKEFLLETAVDAAFDIALNMYTAAAIQVDGNTAYDFSISDLVSLLDNSKNQLANKAIDIVDTLGVSAIVNTIISDVCDFAAIEQAILNGTPVAEYEVTTKSWNFVPRVEANGNYLTIDLDPANEQTGKLSIVVAGTDANKQALAAIFGELKDIVTVEVIEIIVNDVSYNGGFNVDYSATANVTVDLSENNDYAALVATAVAYKLPAGAQKDAIVAALDAYFTSGSTEALVAALENVTAAQVIAAIKGLGNETCENMLTSLGFTSDSVVALEAAYGYMIDIAAKVLNRLDITGPALTLKGFKVDGEFATYGWAKDNVKGYNIDVALTLILASEEIPTPPPAEDPVEIEAPTVDLNDAEVTEIIRGFYYDTAANNVYLDAKCMGITAAQLLEHVKFTITNATIEDIYIYVVDANGNKCADNALVGTGYSIVVNASNSVSAETLTVRIIMVGDVNGNGKVDSGDAAMMARYYLGLDTLTEAQILAADNNRNGKVDSGDAARIAAKYTYTWDDNTYESFYKA